MSVFPDIDELSVVATGRSGDRFAEDLDGHRAEIAHQVTGARLLFVGGAGSIGAATLKRLLPFQPAAIHVVDHNENNLAELVRDLRSNSSGLAVEDFRALPLDFGAPVMARFLREEPAYDLVLNFAALKHVRSEKDVYALTQMLDTNVVKQARFLCWLREGQGNRRYFCVSTDKAANPVNLMGASKRVLEHVLFSGVVASSDALHLTSARFANVAFSEGSLLDSFIRRFQKRQPIAVPRGVRRYFVSLQESGTICVLAAVLGPHGHILVPRLDPDADASDLETVAVAFLRQNGLEPRRYNEETVARVRLEADLAAGGYPVLVTEADTTGEKPFEEFIGPGERAISVGLRNLLGVRYTGVDAAALGDLLSRLQCLVAGESGDATKSDVVEWVERVLPEFRHRETGKSLDQRM